MTWEEYRDFCSKGAIYPDHGTRSMVELTYLGLGLGGETGEALDIIKKAMRRGDKYLSVQDGGKLRDELGDLFWYFTRLVWYVGEDLESIMEHNTYKLTERAKRGEIKDR